MSWGKGKGLAQVGEISSSTQSWGKGKGLAQVSSEALDGATTPEPTDPCEMYALFPGC